MHIKQRLINNKTAIALALTTCTITINAAHAARPFITDDATIVDNCQIESWWQRDNGQSSFWLVPACNMAGVELAVGGTKTASNEKNSYTFSAKTELKALQPNHFGITLGVSHDIAAGDSLRGDTHLNIALTKSGLDDQFLIHVNAGHMLRQHGNNDWTTGIAGQWQAAESQWLFAELYREQAGRPYYQLGYLVEVLPDRLQLDASYGNRFHEKGGENFVSAGLVFYFSAF